MSNEATTYVSAIIMRNVTGEERDEIVSSLENEDTHIGIAIEEGRAEEVYLPLASDPAQMSTADVLRQTAAKLILQAEQIEVPDRSSAMTTLTLSPDDVAYNLLADATEMAEHLGHDQGRAMLADLAHRILNVLEDEEVGNALPVVITDQRRLDDWLNDVTLRVGEPLDIHLADGRVVRGEIRDADEGDVPTDDVTLVVLTSTGETKRFPIDSIDTLHYL